MMTKEEAVAEIDMELKAAAMCLETCRNLSTGAVDDKGAFASHLRSIEALKMAKKALLALTFTVEQVEDALDLAIDDGRPQKVRDWRADLKKRLRERLTSQQKGGGGND